ncbi:MAG: copper chaperone [Gaiellales bacterium]|jgi:copper chaperone CopZ|nr:copper chaperone [Gaiellales bacterium]
METLAISVRGMSCGGCEQRVREVLLRLDGVQAAVPEHIGDEVEVTFDPAKVDLARIREVIVAAGFAA